MEKFRTYIEFENKEEEEKVLKALKDSGIDVRVIGQYSLYYPLIELETKNYFNAKKKDVEKQYEKLKPSMTLEEYSEKLIEHVATKVYKYGDISEDIQNAIDFTNDWTLER